MWCVPKTSTLYAHFIPIVGVGKRGAYLMVHDGLPRQHSFGLSAVNAIGTQLRDPRNSGLT